MHIFEKEGSFGYYSGAFRGNLSNPTKYVLSPQKKACLGVNFWAQIVQNSCLGVLFLERGNCFEYIHINIFKHWFQIGQAMILHSLKRLQYMKKKSIFSFNF